MYVTQESGRFHNIEQLYDNLKNPHYLRQLIVSERKSQDLVHTAGGRFGSALAILFSIFAFKILTHQTLPRLAIRRVDFITVGELTSRRVDHEAPVYMKSVHCDIACRAKIQIQ